MCLGHKRVPPLQVMDAQSLALHTSSVDSLCGTAFQTLYKQPINIFGRCQLIVSACALSIIGSVTADDLRSMGILIGPRTVQGTGADRCHMLVDMTAGAPFSHWLLDLGSLHGTNDLVLYTTNAAAADLRSPEMGCRLRIDDATRHVSVLRDLFHTYLCNTNLTCGPNQVIFLARHKQLLLVHGRRGSKTDTVRCSELPEMVVVSIHKRFVVLSEIGRGARQSHYVKFSRDYRLLAQRRRMKRTRESYCYGRPIGKCKASVS